VITVVMEIVAGIVLVIVHIVLVAYILLAHRHGGGYAPSPRLAALGKIGAWETRGRRWMRSR
jgi:hypothetical protein